MKIMSLAIVLNISILCSQQLPVLIKTFDKYLFPHYDVDNDGVNELINMVYPAADSIEFYYGTNYQLKYKVEIPMDELLWSGIIWYNPVFDFDGNNQMDLLGRQRDINGKDVGFQIRTISTNTVLFTYTDSDAAFAAQSWIKVFRAPLYQGNSSYFIVAIKMFDANGENETNKTLIFSDPSVSVATSKLNFPSKFRLNQNFPNPFNPVTNIPYHINKSGHILLNIYDIKGRLVETLVNKYHEVGSYSAVWNPKELSSGQYFYLIEIDGQPTTAKKAIFLK